MDCFLYLLSITVLLSRSLALAGSGYFTTITDPFMPGWPTTSPGPVYFAMPFAIPKGGGSLGVINSNASAFGLNNFPLLPVQQTIQYASTILAVQNVEIDWMARSLPAKPGITATVDTHFLIVGTNLSELVILEDYYYNQQKPANAPPRYVYRRDPLGGGQRNTLKGVLGSSFAPSDFCDLDNDGSPDEFFLGGSTGKLQIIKMVWNNPGNDNPSTLDISPTIDQRILGFNNLAVISTESFSKPTCVAQSAATNYVAVGFMSGTIMAFKYDKVTFLWTLLQSVSIDYTAFVYSAPILGTPQNNLWAAPAWIDLDGDNLPDGLAVGYKNGAFNLLFSSYSRGTTCNPPVCALGFFVLGCNCRPCPAGTYLAANTQQWCKVCGEVDLYCPEGSQTPQTRSAAQCTYWAPYPSASDPVDVSPNFRKDVSYYTDNYSGAKVILGDGTTVTMDTFWTSSSMQQEMFGGMKAWRNRAGDCGSVQVDTWMYQNILGASPTNGLVTSTRPFVVPTIGEIAFDLTNPGSTPINLTFVFNSSDSSFSYIVDPSQNFLQVSTATIPANTTQEFRVRVQTGFIPPPRVVNNQMNLTLQVANQPYWNQQDDFVSEFYNSISVTFIMSFQDATILALPSSITVDTQSSSITTRSIQIFSLQDSPAVISVDVQYNSQPGWLAWNLEGAPGDYSIGSISKCQLQGANQCDVVSQPLSAFSRFLTVTFNSTGLFNGYYFANIIINSVVVQLQMNVQGGPVLWSMSTINYQDQSGHDIAIGTDPGFRVDAIPQLAIVARDSLGNPTNNFESATNPNGGSSQIQVEVNWIFDWATGYPNATSCPLSASQCNGTVYAYTTGQTGQFVARFPVFAKGPYIIIVYGPNDEMIGNRLVPNVDTLPNPMTVNVSAVVCGDPNAVPNELGSQCLCDAGYGQQEGSYSDVTCTTCSAGTYNDGSTGQCNPCPPGYYQDTQGSTNCKRCSDYKSTPDGAKQSCVACQTFEYVRDDDNSWACQGCQQDQRVRVMRDAFGNELNFSHPTLPGVFVQKYFCSCNANMYWSNTLGRCIDCPSGGFCVDLDEDHLLPRNGYWGPIKLETVVPNVRRRMSGRDLQTVTSSPTTSSTYDAPSFYKCRLSSACPGVDITDALLSVDDSVYAALNAYNSLTNSTVDCTQCVTGFTGPLCFKCAAGYTRAGVNSCTQCLSRSAVVVLLLIGAFFAIVVCIYIIRRTLITMNTESDSAEEMILLRVLMSHLQSESMVQGIDLDWPAFVLSMFDVFNLISSTGQSAFSLDCFVDQQPTNDTDSCTVFTDNRLRTFFLSALFIALLPVFGFMCSSVYWIGRYIYIKRTTGKGRGRSFYQYNLVSIIIIVFLLYPSLVRTGFKFFSASSEMIAGNRFLEADFNIVFGSQEHLTWALCLGLPMIIIYALGVPLGFLYILRTRRADTHRYGKVFTFLYTGFQPQYYYWEVVIMVRKLGIAACTIMVKPYGADIQAFSTAVVVFIFICLQLHVRPYTHSAMNFMEFFGLATLYLTLFLGLFQSSVNINLGQNSSVNTAFGILIVLVNTFFLVFIFYKLFQVTLNTSKEHGWRHALIVLVSLGNYGSKEVIDKELAEESFKDKKGGTRTNPSNSVVVAVDTTETGNPVYAKELHPSKSAVPQYHEVYDISEKNLDRDGHSREHVDYTKPS